MARLLASLIVFLTLLKTIFGDGLVDVDLRKKPYRGYHDRIVCQVCQILTLQMVREAKKAKEELKKKDPNAIITEDYFLDMVEDICNPFTDIGIWLTFFDIVKKPPYLILEYKEKVGKCKEECETIALSCNKIKNEYEFELVEKFMTKISTKESVEEFCLPMCKSEKHDVGEDEDVGGDEWVEETPDHRQLFLSLLRSKSDEEDKFPYPKKYIDSFVRAEVDNKEKAKKEAVRRCIRRAKQKAIDSGKSQTEIDIIARKAKKKCKDKQKRKDDKEKGKFKKKKKESPPKETTNEPDEKIEDEQELKDENTKEDL